jgi:hypothetical protein
MNIRLFSFDAALRLQGHVYMNREADGSRDLVTLTVLSKHDDSHLIAMPHTRMRMHTTPRTGTRIRAPVP